MLENCTSPNVNGIVLEEPLVKVSKSRVKWLYRLKMGMLNDGERTRLVLVGRVLLILKEDDWGSLLKDVWEC